ncbi:ABC transporter ATP-binding protein [Vineibacter terrae]|uniref:ABC transporter ATP-binding protein n=1 Tax=Vineibacter terrae TaxID=2586908 RepID=UPI002E342649|nr:ABC transporter ATP-binding protein [Vineibacter terrae]HEX2887289.1 ABC transporter ATP-binding protein [Vineibacter terrae]
MSLEIDGVSKSFGGLQILQDVSIAVPAGGLVGLIGPNGAGKSTLFAVVGGFEPADAGHVRFEGRTLDSLSPQARARQGLMRTFQVPRPFSHLTVRENLAVSAPHQKGERLRFAFLAGGVLKREQAAIAEQAGKVMDFLRLAPVADLPAGQLSGGQRKLLELGRMLMCKPRMILLDEPFAGVNPVLYAEIADRIVAINQSGIGFLIVEHNIPALTRMVNQLHVLDRGRIIAHGPPDDVLKDARVRTAYIGGGS